MIFDSEEGIRQAGQCRVGQYEGKKVRGEREWDGRKL